MIPHGGKSSQQKKARIGYDYVHSMVDDHTRLAYSEILPDEKGDTCAMFLRRGRAAFEKAFPAPSSKAFSLSVPISALLLVLLAIPLAYVNPRMGRSLNLFTALFMYMLYSNCLNIVQSFIAQGKLGFWAGLALPHTIALAVILLLKRIKRVPGILIAVVGATGAGGAGRAAALAGSPAAAAARAAPARTARNRTHRPG